MPAFKGFLQGKIKQTPLPEPFFRELLPAIDHIGELKLTLYVFWRLNRMEGKFRYLTRDEIAEHRQFMDALAVNQQQAEKILDEALALATQRGTLLAAEIRTDAEARILYFLNSAQGRAAVEAITGGEWDGSQDNRLAFAPDVNTPNIFELYERNIGPLTPMIAEALREAEETYPASWIEDALRIAVENNARNWRYVVAILDRWLVEGHHDRKDRKDTEEDRRRYIEGEFADFIEH